VNWSYTESDPAMMLFTAALERFGMTFPPGSKILELGCAETNWLERMAAADPSFELTGVDCYPQPRPNVIAGDACNPDLFPPDTFDRIVMLGALEHFGLGFYGDPIHERDGEPVGDMLTMMNVYRWLKPGGCVYFDVPCQPVGSIKENRHFREFSPQDVTNRLILQASCNHLGRGPLGYEGGVPLTTGPLLRELARGYSWPEPWAGTWCDEPTAPLVPYWFVAVWAQKP